jgi:LemA protein
MPLMRGRPIHRLLSGIVSAFVLLASGGCGYKSLQQQDEDVRTSWSEVVSQYQRRAELIAGLAGSLQPGKTPMGQTLADSEQALIRATQANARSGALPAAPALLSNPAAFASYQAMQDQLTRSLRNLMGLSAAYPQLMADANFRDLRAQLQQTEEQIDSARRRYAEAVRTFNASIRTFPTDLTARMFDYNPKPSLPSGPGEPSEPSELRASAPY